MVGLSVLVTPCAAGAEALDQYRPTLRSDAQERHLAMAVDPVLVGGRPDPRRFVSVEGEPRVYGREVAAPGGGRFLQYWIFYAQNTQDRGIVRTGRHAGDWELVQVRLDSRGRPQVTTFAQHAVAERCAARGAPTVFVANGSHASHPEAGEHGRQWPDPDDEADGRGALVRPPVTRIEEGTPAWMGYRGRWGGSEAGPIPGEQSSPRGPAFQDVRWEDPAAFERSARPCGTATPGRGWQWPLVIALAVAALLCGGFLVRRSRAR